MRRILSMTTGLGAMLFASSAVLALSTAAPASASVPKIGQCEYAGGTGYTSVSITVMDSEICGNLTIKLNVSISQFTAQNVWVVVASGTGQAHYVCNGTLRTVYKTTEPGIGTGSEQFYDNCG